jgi:hypothetical protein
VNAPLEEGLDLTAQVMLTLLRKRVFSRRVRVLLFARATRVALDALPLDQHGPGFVRRTWELPELAASAQAAMNFISNEIDRVITIPVGRAILLARTTQLAIDELSPDEQISAKAEAAQIIGTPPWENGARIGT